jgi:acetylornithine deacetylase/succinyl-diaminopimelate desuccinylase-like protein
LKNMCAHILKKYDATVEQEAYGWLVHTDTEHPAIQSYKKHSDLVTWWDLQFEVMHGATDAKYFSEKWSVCILHGPNGQYLHAAWEYLELESLYTLYDITKSYVCSE